MDGSYAFTDLSSEQYTVIASGYPPVATQVTLNGSQETGEGHVRIPFVVKNQG